jgi:hypothetical protein
MSLHRSVRRRSRLSLTGAHDGGEHPGEYLAGEYFFEHGAHRRPPRVVPRRAGIDGVGRPLLQALAPPLLPTLRGRPVRFNGGGRKRPAATDQHRPVGANDGSQFDEFASMHGQTDSVGCVQRTTAF